MKRWPRFHRSLTAISVVLVATQSGQFTANAQETFEELPEGTILLDEVVVLSAEEQLKQSLGVSVITSEDIERQPPVRDVSELVRRQPGVNLTGNTAGGQYGQSRQIDIRGMGPENTLILIDGKPVLSRNSARMGRQGERDTRGDSNWVAPELIERIEVIRGPAAARYGSGAAGGVVNIITKRPETTSYSVSTFLEVPESSKEGGTRRVTATAAGPINDMYSYRLSASGAWTDPDAVDINPELVNEDGTTTSYAGREGVVTYNLNALISAEIDFGNRIDFEAGWTRQANRFVGGQPSGVIDPDGTGFIDELARSEAETSRLDRYTLSMTHIGQYDFGDSNSYIQWERTNNRRLRENTATGGGEAEFIASDEYRTNVLDNLAAKSEWVLPLDFWREQKLTVGAEYRGEFLKGFIGNDSLVTNQPDKADAHLVGIYIEDNILITDQLTLTPGVRLDYHDSFGANLSPSLNASYALTDEITFKAGVARAFKAPNLFQLSPDFIYQSMGMGCPIWYSGGCSMRGNPDLEPEISINKEIGVAYVNVDGWAASLTYYHNDYENKIVTGVEPVGIDPSNGWTLFPWENSGPAVISGLEGSVTVPVHERVTWTTNFTYILESEREVYGRIFQPPPAPEPGSDLPPIDGVYHVPLSLVPEYTINTSVRWEPIEELGLTLSATHYGKTEAGAITTRGLEVSPENRISRDPYTLVNFAVDYEPTESIKLSAGVNNLFDKTIQATAGAIGNNTTSNANTFNEPGRSYWASVTARF